MKGVGYQDELFLNGLSCKYNSTTGTKNIDTYGQ